MLRNLHSMLEKPWHSVAAQGGVLNASADGLAVDVSGIWFQSNEKWIEIAGIEDSDDQYFLEIVYCEIAPVPEPDPINYPPRKVISRFPQVCPLHALAMSGAKIIHASELNQVEGGFRITSVLDVSSHLRKTFRFEASEMIKGNIRIMVI